MCVERPEVRHPYKGATERAGATAAHAAGVTAQRLTAAFVGVACTVLLGALVEFMVNDSNKSDEIMPESLVPEC